MSELVVAIVADDLTGAMDAAAPFARRSARTRVVIALEHLVDVLDQGSLPEVLAINTESRHLPADQAARRVTEAFEKLLPFSPHILFKKIDSTLRGNVIAECLAARRSSGRRLLVCPAVPAQGRTLLGGQVYVHGEPLAATDYGCDARSAPPAEPLPILFAREGLSIPVMPAGGVPEASDLIADAVDGTGMQRLAQELLKAPQQWLVVGAAGLTEALADCLFSKRVSLASTTPPLDKLLIAVGSRCDQARRQVACLCEAAPGLPIIHAMERDMKRHGPARQRLIIPEYHPSARFTAEQVAQGMAHCVQMLLEEEEPGQAPLLFLTGGDTAMAVMEQLGTRYIDLIGEWAPGVAWGWLDGDRQRPVMTKAGGFGDDALLMHLGQASTTRG